MQDTLTSSLLLTSLHVCAKIGTIMTLHNGGYQVKLLWYNLSLSQTSSQQRNSHQCGKTEIDEILEQIF